MSHKNFKKRVIEVLRAEPKFRERRNKDRGFVWILLQRSSYAALASSVGNGFARKDDLIRFIQDAASLDRAWRQALAEDLSLRGSDYGKKKVLEQEHQVELGYTAGYDNDVHRLREATDAP